MRKLNALTVYMTLAVTEAFLFGMIFTYSMVYQVTVAKLAPLQLVLVGTLLEITVFTFEVPTGIIADVYSRRLSIIIGYLMTGLAFLIEGSFPIFAMILLAQLIWGLGATFTSGATAAWIADEIGEEACGKAFLRGAQAGEIGGLIGIMVATALAGVRVNLPIQAGGLLFLALAIFLILFMPEHGFSPTRPEDRSSIGHMTATFRDGLGVVRSRPALLNILAIVFFIGLYSEGYDRLWTKLLVDEFVLPSLGSLQPVAWFGLMRASGILLTLAITEILRRKLDTNNYLAVARSLYTLTAMLAASLFVFARAEVFWLALIAFWAIWAIRNASGPLFTAWINQRLDSRLRATVLSMSNQVDAFGQIAGGPLVGWIGSAISVRAAITTSSLILTPVLLLFIRAMRRGGREQKGVESGGEVAQPDTE